jgi:hypothetical protein
MDRLVFWCFGCHRRCCGCCCDGDGGLDVLAKNSDSSQFDSKTKVEKPLSCSNELSMYSMTAVSDGLGESSFLFDVSAAGCGSSITAPSNGVASLLDARLERILPS